MRLIALFLSASFLFAAPPRTKRAKNVILFLADAGGLGTLTAASLYGYNAPHKLFVHSWPNMGLSDTTPVGRWVSDSAAGMTAIVTGQKTNNGMISQGPDGVRGKKDGTPLKTILEYAEERGLATGVVSNMTITDATPAACYAHVNDRANFADIFAQLFEPRFGDGVDVLIGPGRKRIFGDLEKAGKNIESIATAKNRRIYESLDQVPESDRRALVVSDGDFDLAASAKRALKMLHGSKKGFFLMVEGDAHTNVPERGLSRLVAFDKLIREMAASVDLDETLLIFTADHSFEFSIVGGGPDSPLLKGADEWGKTSGGKGQMRIPSIRMENSHTGEDVVVLGMGAGSEQIRGFGPNTRVFHVMMNALGWKESQAISGNQPTGGRPAMAATAR